LFKTGIKIYYFCQHSKKAKKWPNGQTILFMANSFIKGQIGQKKFIGHHHIKHHNKNKSDSHNIWRMEKLKASQ